MAEVDFMEGISYKEYPFFWNLKTISVDKKNVLDSVQQKEEDVSDPYHKFIYGLLLSYEYAIEDDLNRSGESLENCKSYLDKDDFMSTYETAFSNLLGAMSAHLEFLKGNVSEAHHVCELEELSPIQQSAVWATRAHVVMQYGDEGTRKAVEFVRKALELHESEARWHLLLGRLLSRIRHFENTFPRPSEEELIHFEMGMILEESSELAIFLALSYLDLTTSIWRQNISSEHDLMDYYNKKAYNLLCRALKLKTVDDSHTLIRCARGFHKLPKSFKCRELTIELMNNALQKLPDDPLINHYSALICIKNNRLREAVRYLTVALNGGVDVAVYSLIKTKLMLEPNYDAGPLFDKALTVVTNDEKKQYIHLQAASFYYFCRKELVQAVNHLIEAIHLNPDNEILKDFKGNFYRSSEDMTLLRCVSNHIKYIQTAKVWFNTYDLEKMSLLMEMLKKIIPEEVTKEPEPVLLWGGKHNLISSKEKQRKWGNQKTYNRYD